MKIAAVAIAGIIISELAWAYYTSTVLTITQSLELMLLTAIVVMCAVIGWGVDVK